MNTQRPPTEDETGQPEARLVYNGETLATATGQLAAKYLERVHEEAEPMSADLPDRRVAELVVGRSGSRSVTQEETPAIVADFIEEYSASADATPGDVDLLRSVLEEVRVRTPPQVQAGVRRTARGS